MRHGIAEIGLAALLVASAGCGGVTASRRSVSAAGPSSRSSAQTALVFVEASGEGRASGDFASRLLGELSRDPAITVSDGRLAGAKALVLASAPHAPEAVAFRKAFPGDAHLLVDVQPCEVRQHDLWTREPANEAGTPGLEGSVQEVRTLYSTIQCFAAVTLTSAADGHRIASFSIAGEAPHKTGEDRVFVVEHGKRVKSPRSSEADTGDPSRTPEEKALMDAAKKAARRISAALSAPAR